MSVDTFAPGTDSSSLWLDASLSSGGAGQQCPREKPDVQAQAGSRPGRLLWLSPSIEGEFAATLGSVSTTEELDPSSWECNILVGAGLLSCPHGLKVKSTISCWQRPPAENLVAKAIL